MNTYVTGNTIRLLREAKGLTQAELARQLLVSAKTVSKWETAKGLPDISLRERAPLHRSGRGELLRHHAARVGYCGGR